MSAADWATEHYSADDSAVLAQLLYDSGLLYLVNAAVLHHQLALGVRVDDDGDVIGLSLHHSDDPDGIWFGEDATIVGRRKLAQAGLRRSTP